MNPSDNNYLIHYGILGMKWGVRRYQYKDGRLTPAGKKRYRDSGVIASGNRYRVYGDKDGLTEEDLRTLVNQIDLTKKLDDLVNDPQNDRSSIRKEKRSERKEEKEQRKTLKEEAEKRKLQEEQAAEQQKLKEAREKTDRILKTTGTVITVGSSLVALLTAIKKFKGSESEDDQLEREAKRAENLSKIRKFEEKYGDGSSERYTIEMGTWKVHD